MASATLKRRVADLEAVALPGPADPPYIVAHVVDGARGAKEEPLEPGVRDWVAEVDGHRVCQDAGESFDQLCQRAVSLHGRTTVAVNVILAAPYHEMFDQQPDEADW